MNDLVRKKKINLKGKGICDHDLDVLTKVLKKSTVLEELTLRSNHITLSNAKFTEALAQNSTLKILDLSKNDIDAAGYQRLAESLKVNDTLQEIYLYCNAIGDDGAQSLAEALQVNRSLQCLSSSHSSIGDRGAECLATSFLVNKSLRKIDLDGNRIGNRGAESLANALVRNKVIEVLSLGDNPISQYVSRKMKSILDDPNRKIQNESVGALQRLEETIANKNAQIAAREEELARKDAVLASKEDLIRSLQERNDHSDETFESATASADSNPRAENRGPAHGRTPETEDARARGQGMGTPDADTAAPSAVEPAGAAGDDDSAPSPQCHYCATANDETFVLMPCGHILCSACHLTYSSKCCPVCRREVEEDGARLRSGLEQSTHAIDGLRGELGDARAAAETVPLLEARVGELLEELKRKDLEVKDLEEEVGILRGCLADM